jgi:hypothetical protein
MLLWPILRVFISVVVARLNILKDPNTFDLVGLVPHYIRDFIGQLDQC